ncbi:Hsp70 family protein [Geodermatophilus sp. SYSU D01180]
MDERSDPGSEITPLDLVWLVDCSGSMRVDGRLGAVDRAIRDALRHSRVVARDRRIRLFVRALLFSSGSRWHVRDPVPVEHLVWPELQEAGGYTDLGAALREVAAVLRASPAEPGAPPPVLVLVSDGEPTDDVDEGIRALADTPRGVQAQRFAVGLGPDADLDVLRRFVGSSAAPPVSVPRPEQLPGVLRGVCSMALDAATAGVTALPQQEAARTASGPPRSGRSAAIDFGTTYTSAAVRDGEGRVHTIAFDSGLTRSPSGVLRLTDGSLLVGSLAEAQAALYPQAFEATPKRLMGYDTVVLGGEETAVVDLVAAVLRHAAAELDRQQGKGREVLLTHPADWRRPRLAVLRRAAARAGLGDVTLVPEPVAAAAAYTTDDDVTRGSVAAVYDLGGGTFDAAVVERTETGWAVAGPPAGIDPLGGVDFDRLLLGHVGGVVAGRDPAAWAALSDPPDMVWRRRRRELQREVRAAKEALSTHPSWTVFVPGVEETVTLTVEDLERLIAPLVDRTVDVMVATIRESGRRPDQLQAVYMTGGSSRIPLVHRRLWDALGVEPLTGSDPKLVVVTGALC